jgi:hypothetical protein
MPTQTIARPEEARILRDLLDLFDQAKGDSDVLADVRRQISAQIDDFCSQLRSHGVDTDALLDELDDDDL